ncbi:TPA: DUF2218 domain-containing protein [Vibrio vulnificus]
MLIEKTTISSEYSGKYLQTLCRHFARKVPAIWDDFQGKVTFSIGVTKMQFDPQLSTLTIVCQSDTPEALSQQKAVIESHVGLFARREALQLKWQAQSNQK